MASEFDLIDRVARQMTEAEPPGDFRVRVIARLPSARPQPWWHVAALAGGGVAAGMLIMAAVSVWSNRTHAPVQASTHAEHANVNRGGTPVSTASPPVIHYGVPNAQIRGVRSTGGAGPMETAGQIDPPFPLLSITPIQPPELSIAPIVVGPLTAGSIALPPIVK